jgi:hypothetical protein
MLVVWFQNSSLLKVNSISNGCIAESLFRNVIPGLIAPAFLYSGMKVVFQKLKLTGESHKDAH